MRHTPTPPNKLGITRFEKINVRDVVPYIDWKFFFHAWKLSDHTSAEAQRLKNEAESVLDELINKGKIETKGIVGLYEARGKDEEIIIRKEGKEIVLPMLRQQRSEENRYLSLADYIAEEKDWIGVFACSVEIKEKETEEYKKILQQTLSDRLAEATAEWLHEQIRKRCWGFGKDENIGIAEMLMGKYQGIRPAVGYPSLPDQSIINKLAMLIPLKDIGIEVTENGAMIPCSSVCGLVIENPNARYFRIGEISREQAEDYANRQGWGEEELTKYIGHLIVE